MATRQLVGVASTKDSLLVHIFVVGRFSIKDPPKANALLCSYLQPLTKGPALKAPMSRDMN